MCSGKDNENLSGKEFHGVIICYGSNVFPPTERHRQLIQMCSDDVMRIQNVRKWCRIFSELVEIAQVVVMSVTDVNASREVGL